MLTRPQLDVRLDGWLLFLLRVILVGALADLSFRFIEMPFRRGRVPSVRAAGAMAAGLVLFSTSVAAAKPAERPAYLPVDATDTWSAAAATATEPPITLTADATPAIEAVADTNREVAADPTVEPAPEPTTTSAPATSLQVAASPPQSPLGVTAIGDSVMLGAVQALEADIPGVVVGAAISRQTSTAIERLRARAASGQLGDVVIVHMGNNGTFSASQFDSIMDVLANVLRVVFINVKVPRAWEATNNAVIADGVQRYPNTVMVDWHAVGIERPDFFWDDGIHLRPEGAAAYAALIAAPVTT